MQFFSSLLISIFAATTCVSAGRKYEREAAKHLLQQQCFRGECDGWSPLPPKASYSQCSLALERIVKQPQSCAQKYMSNAARAVYSPVYLWFGDNIDYFAQQFARENGVGIMIYDAFGINLVSYDSAGNPEATTNLENVPFMIARTWGLNYPTFARYEEDGVAFLVQNVYNFDGQMLTVALKKQLTELPVVC